MEAYSAVEVQQYVQQQPQQAVPATALYLCSCFCLGYSPPPCTALHSCIFLCLSGGRSLSLGSLGPGLEAAQTGTGGSPEAFRGHLGCQLVDSWTPTGAAVEFPLARAWALHRGLGVSWGMELSAFG